MSSSRSGLLAGLATFTAWGLVPLYWRQIRSVPAFEILAHRAIWSVVFVAILLTFHRQWREVMQTPRALAITALRGVLVTSNWFIFIWAVNAGHIVETSMGYFITPLLSLVFGMLVFREKLRTRQWIAVGLAFCGVLVVSTLGNQGFPWIAVSLAVTFACYGALKKVARIGPMPGLFLETGFIMPIAVVFLLSKANSVSLLPIASHTSLFLIGGGIITAFPLLWFAHAASELRLTTISFLQFLAPSLSFLVGVFVYKEQFSDTRLVAFCFIWAGVLLFSFDAWLWSRDSRQTLSVPIAME